jgi:hypothetical protein
MSFKSSVTGLDNWLDRKLDKLPEPKRKRRPDDYERGIKSRLRRASTTIKSLDDMGDRVAGRMTARMKERGGLEAFYDKLLNRPIMSIMIVLLITGISTIPAQAILTNMRGDLESYLPGNDPATNTLKEVNKDWTTDSVIIYVEVPKGSGLNITSVEVLKEMSAVEGDALNSNRTDWRLRGADWNLTDRGKRDNITAVLSISSVIKTINATPSLLSNAIKIEFPALPKLPPLPGNYSIPTQNTVNKILAQIDPMLLKMLVVDKDKNGVYDTAAIILMIKRGSDPAKIVPEVDELIKFRAKAAGHSTPYTIMTNTGPYTVIQKMQGRTIFEFLKVLPFLVIFLMCVLFFFHRNIRVIPITLAPVGLALGMTLGITGLVSTIWPGTFIITPQIALVIPVLLALGIAYGLYISNRYVEETTGTPKEKMIVTVKAMNNALFLSAFAEFIGFASLMFGTLPPIFTMGFSLAIGIMLTYMFTMLVIPPMVMVLGYEKKVEFSAWSSFAPVPSSNRKKILAIALILTLISVITIPMIQFDADYLGMMPSDDPSVVKMTEYSNVMGGGMMGMVVVRANAERYEPLDVTDSVEQDMNHVKYSLCLSIVDIMKMVRTPSNITIPIGGGVQFPIQSNISYWDLIQRPPQPIPFGNHNDSQQMYIRIFYNTLGPEMEWMFLNPSKTKMLIYVFQPNLDIPQLKVAVGGIDSIIDQRGAYFSGGTMSHLTGVGALTLAINDLIIVGSLQTLALSIFLCWAVLAIVFRSWKIGLMTMIPCLLVISYEPLTLVGMNIPLSIVTVMIGSIAIGTGVDFAIQISQRMTLMGFGIKQVLNTVEHMGVSFVEATTTMIIGFAAVLVAPWPASAGAGVFGLPFTLGVGINSVKQFVLMIMLLLIFNAVCALFVLPAIYTIVIRFREADRKRKLETAKMAKRIQFEKELPADLEAEMEEVSASDSEEQGKERTYVVKRVVDEEEIPKIY